MNTHILNILSIENPKFLEGVADFIWKKLPQKGDKIIIEVDTLNTNVLFPTALYTLLKKEILDSQTDILQSFNKANYSHRIIKDYESLAIELTKETSVNFSVAVV